MLRAGMDRTRNRTLVGLGMGRGALALAIITLSFLLLRPVCAAAENYDVPPLPSDACCVSIDESASVGSSIPKIPDAKSAVMAAPLVVPQLALAVSDPLAGVRQPGAPPRPAPC